MSLKTQETLDLKSLNHRKGLSPLLCFGFAGSEETLFRITFRTAENGPNNHNKIVYHSNFTDNSASNGFVVCQSFGRIFVNAMPSIYKPRQQCRMLSA